jgi:hypothetical protein
VLASVVNEGVLPTTDVAMRLGALRLATSPTNRRHNEDLAGQRRAQTDFEGKFF